MNPNIFVDKRSIMQVLGNLINYPKLFDRSDKYTFNLEDFGEIFYKIIFGTVNNLKAQGLDKIEILDIDNYLSTRPNTYKIFNDNKGIEYISEIVKIADLAKFDYYYNRMKKMTLLRMYITYGIDITWLYDPNSLNIELKQNQEDWLDASSLLDISLAIDDKIDEIKSKYLNSLGDTGVQAGDKIEELINELKEVPEVGIPLYGSLMNTITRGARLKKFYLRSAPTSVGKTRLGIADACYFSCGTVYDIYSQKWIKGGSKEATLFITTEQETEEVQTMMLAFLSGVNEEKILNGYYEYNEEDRVREAGRIIKESPIWIEELHDFSLDDIENTINKYVIDHDVKYVVFDYIHTSLKILEEITRKSGGIRLREDNILTIFSIRLKDLCNKLNIFLYSATQVNADWEGKKDGNQNLIRGAKAIADKIDFGSIVLPVTENDLKCLENLIIGNSMIQPNLVYHIYKNRRGKFTGVKLWCTADLGTCRVTPRFLTSNNYKLIPIEDFVIEVEEVMQDVV